MSPHQPRGGNKPSRKRTVATGPYGHISALG